MPSKNIKKQKISKLDKHKKNDFKPTFETEINMYNAFTTETTNLPNLIKETQLNPTNKETKNLDGDFTF